MRMAVDNERQNASEMRIAASWAPLQVKLVNEKQAILEDANVIADQTHTYNY